MYKAFSAQDVGFRTLRNLVCWVSRGCGARVWVQAGGLGKAPFGSHARTVGVFLV